MNVVIFLGPSLPESAARTELEATYLPPASQGDLYRAARERPFAIGLVDGYFERVPSVWHKEILWAMSQGIHVFGAASMGALRAAELDRFGMRGIGSVYDAFRSGVLADDDEVAVTHTDAASGYRALSDAMVNIRATLRASVEAGVLDEALAGRLEAQAKGSFYPERSFARLLVHAVEAGEPPARIEALRAFATSSFVDVKRNDTLALLRAVRACVEAGRPPAPVAYAFARTEAWDQVVEWSDTQPPLTLQEPVDVELLAAETRLAGESGRALLAASLARAAGASLAASAPAAVMAQVRTTRDREWRRAARDGGACEPGSDDETSFPAWLSRNGLTESTYPAFVDRDAQTEWLKDRFGAEAFRFLADELRGAGLYETLYRQARDKQATLTAHGLSEPTLEDAKMDPEPLLAWYFEERLRRPRPADLPRYCRQAGLAGVAALEREAMRELLFQRLRNCAPLL